MIQEIQNLSGRELWRLVRYMQDENGYCHQSSREMFLLEKGAYLGDVWSMTELARYLYRVGDSSLPQALSWWKKAAVKNDEGCLRDLSHWDIEKRIINYYCEGCSVYANIEMQCAMLTEWILTGLGRNRWLELSMDERERRCKKLVSMSCNILGIPKIEIVFINNLIFQGSPVHGLAYAVSKKIEIEKKLLDDLERLIQVIFHELGHHVVYSMYDKNSHQARNQRERFGLSEGRIQEWKTEKKGISISVTEEDPDTLSYGVWLNWCVFYKD